MNDLTRPARTKDEYIDRLEAKVAAKDAEIERLRDELAAYEQDGGERINAVVAECIRIGALQAIKQNAKLKAVVDAAKAIKEDVTEQPWERFARIPRGFMHDLEKAIAALERADDE